MQVTPWSTKININTALAVVNKKKLLQKCSKIIYQDKTYITTIPKAKIEYEKQL